MATPLFYPTAKITQSLPTNGACTLRQLCENAGVPCRASGAWTNRIVVIARGPTYEIEREPGDWSTVKIGVPASISDLEAARYALAAMAYSLMDGVARESIRGAIWSKPTHPIGRPAKGIALNTRERQRIFQTKKKNKMQVSVPST